MFGASESSHSQGGAQGPGPVSPEKSGSSGATSGRAEKGLDAAVGTPSEPKSATSDSPATALEALSVPVAKGSSAEKPPAELAHASRPAGCVPELIEKLVRRELKDPDHQPLVVFEQALKELYTLTAGSRVDDEIPTRGLRTSFRLSLLAELPPLERRRTVKALWACALSGSRLSPEMRAVLSRMQTVITGDDKESLAKWLYNISKGDTEVENGITSSIGESGRLQALKLLEIVLEGCKSLTELRAVVDGVGKRNLIGLRERPISEFVAIRALGSRMREWRKFSASEPGHSRSMKSGRILKENAPAPVVKRRLDAIKDELALRRKALTEDGRFAGSQALKSYLSIIEKNEEYLSAERRRSLSTKERAGLANLMTRMMEVEFKYNLRLTVEKDAKGKPTCRWTEAWVRDVGAALDGFPEMLIIATPKLRQLQLVESFKDGSYGQRKSNGVVQLSKDAIEGEFRDRVAGNVRLLRSLTTHEVGHSVFYGKSGWGGPKAKKSVEEVSRKTAPKFDFRGFLEIAGWNVISPDRWKLDPTKELVNIDGESLRLQRPVRLPGTTEDVILVYGAEDRTLYSFSNPNGLPSSSYGAADPFEDLAEGVVEYRYAPQRLIKIAPWKFLWFEGELARYDIASGKDSPVRSVLSQSLPKIFPHAPDSQEPEPAVMADPQETIVSQREKEPATLLSARMEHLLWTVERNGAKFDLRIEISSPDAKTKGTQGCQEVLAMKDLRRSDVQAVSLLLLGLRGGMREGYRDPAPAIERISDLMEWARERGVAWASPLANNTVEISARVVELIGDAESRAFWEQQLRSTEVVPGVVSVRCGNGALLASAFCRIQEHYEGPYFRGKVFSLAEYKEWYRKEQRFGRFSYYEDWGGFNVPSSAIDSFIAGGFPQLATREEVLLSKVAKCQRPVYVIGVPEGPDERETFNHELSHGLWAMNKGYREEVGALVRKLPLTAFRRWLIESGYCDQVLDDECAAHLIDECNPFSRLSSAQRGGVSAKDRQRVRSAQVEIAAIFERYAVGAWERHLAL